MTPCLLRICSRLEVFCDLACFVSISDGGGEGRSELVWILFVWLPRPSCRPSGLGSHRRQQLGACIACDYAKRQPCNNEHLCLSPPALRLPGAACLHARITARHCTPAQETFAHSHHLVTITPVLGSDNCTERPSSLFLLSCWNGPPPAISSPRSGPAGEDPRANCNISAAKGMAASVPQALQ